MFLLVMNVFKLLLYHTFKHDEAGFKVIEETLGLLELFGRKVVALFLFCLLSCLDYCLVS